MPPWPGPVPIPHALPWGCGGLGAPASEARPGAICPARMEQMGAPHSAFPGGEPSCAHPHAARWLGPVLPALHREQALGWLAGEAHSWMLELRGTGMGKDGSTPAPSLSPCGCTPQPPSARFSFQGSVASGDLALLASSQVSMDKNCPQCSVPREPPTVGGPSPSAVGQ